MAVIDLLVASVETTGRLAESTSSGASVLMLVVKLMTVLGVIVALAWLLKQMKVGPMAHGRFKVTAALSLGRQERLLKVQVDGEELLLGVTAHQITLLDKQPLDPEQIQANALNAGNGFADRLQSFLKKQQQT